MDTSSHPRPVPAIPTTRTRWVNVNDWFNLYAVAHRHEQDPPMPCCDRHVRVAQRRAGVR